MTQVVKGTLIEWLPQKKDSSEISGQDAYSEIPPLIERVLYTSPTEDLAVLITTDEKIKDMPYCRTLSELENAIDQELAFRRLIDPHASYAFQNAEFLEKHILKRDRAWACIKDIISVEPDIYIKELRGRLIRAAAEENNVERCEIYLYARRWWKRGMHINTLLPAYDKCGGPGKERTIILTDSPDAKRGEDFPKRGRPPRVILVDHQKTGINITENVKKQMYWGHKLYFAQSAKYPLKRAYDLMSKKFFNVGYRDEGGLQVPILAPASERPTYGQYEYWTRKMRREVESVIKRETPKVFNLKHRATLSNSTQMAQGPGAIYQIDATIGDIYLVSSLNRTWIIGRPVIYIVMDVFSRMVVGIYVGLEGPSWAGAMMAIVNATSDKVAYYAEHGLTISYEIFPCVHLCVMWLADRGEMICHDSDKLTQSLDMSVANCPPFRGDFKGIVEQNFGRVNQKVIKWTPGEVRKRASGDRDHRLDAKLTLREFTALLLVMVSEYNQFHYLKDYPMEPDLISDNVKPIPLHLWNWGIVHRSGSLNVKTPDVVRAALMPSGMATVTKRGIKFNGMHYTCDRAERERWFDQAGYGKSWRIPVSYDKRLNDVIYMRIEDGVYEPCTLMDVERRFMGTRLEEVEDFYAIKGIEAALHKDDLAQSGARLDAAKNSIISQATEATNAALAQVNLSNSERTSHIGQYRADEKERLRRKEAFRPGQEPQDVTQSSAPGSGSEGFQAGQEGHLAEPMPDKKMDMLELIVKRSEGGKS